MPADRADRPQFVNWRIPDIALDQSNVLAVQPRFSFRFLPICIVYTSIREGGGAALQTGHPARSVAQSNHAAMWSINKGHGGGKLKGGSVWPSHHRLKP